MEVEPGGEWSEGLRGKDLVPNVANFWSPPSPPEPLCSSSSWVSISVTECHYINCKGLLLKPRQSREILWLAALCADDNRRQSVPDQLHHWHLWYENIISLLHWCELILQGNLINIFVTRLLASPFGRDCTVCVATTHSAWRPRLHGSIPSNSKRFFYSKTSVPDLRPTQPRIKFLSRHSLAG
jgi:hypothetical protein